MSKPIVFGICNQNKNVYMLLTYVEGIDLSDALPTLSNDEQYELGRKAGTILKQIYNQDVEPQHIPTTTKRARKLEQIQRYMASDVRVANDDVALNYITENIDKMCKHGPCYLHGDFHPGNLIYTPTGELGVIDFNRYEVGDPYEEFYKLESFGVEVSIPYCIGQIDAYFAGNVPMEFFETLTVYVAHVALFSIKWAEKFGQADVDGMVRRWLMAYEHYHGFTTVIPSWYSKR
ncbi:MAG TPA: aminoglycoside phosphotransferase [Firmicutes bacterium]|nr:aminoglycoside phosphotransferase [Bacillota bacterium]